MAKRKVVFAIILGFLMLNSLFGQSVNKVRKVLLTKSYDEGLVLLDAKLDGFKDGSTYDSKAIPFLLLKGQTQVKFGQLIQAEQSFITAKSIYDKKELAGSRHSKVEYDVFDEMAMLYMFTGNTLEAKKLVTESLALRKERFSKKDPIRYRTYLPYALYLKSIGEVSEAKMYLAQYQKYIRNSNHTSKSEIDRYADTYRLLYLMEVTPEGSAEALALAKKNYHYQKHLWTKIDAGRNTHKKTEALGFIAAEYFKLEKYGEAQIFLNRAIDGYHEEFGQDGFILASIYLNQAKVHEELDDFSRARAALTNVMSLHLDNIDENFSKLSTKEKVHTYSLVKRDLDEVYAYVFRRLKAGHEMPQRFITSVFEARLKTKAIILNETNKLYEAIVQSQDEELKKSFEHWKLLKNQYAYHVAHEGLDEESVELERQMILLEKGLANSSSLFNGVPDEVGLKELKSNMKTGDCLVEVVRIAVNGTPHYMVMAIHYGEELEMYLLEEGTEMENIYLKFYTNSIKYQIEDANSYKYYLEPLLGGERNVTRLILSPDGVYNQLNLSILKKGVGYVLDELEVVNLTNLLQFMNDDAPVELEEALLIGRPEYFKEKTSNTGDGTRALRGLTRDGVSDLPGTEVEVNSISALLMAHEVKTKVLLGEEATEASLKTAGSYDVLHIATHGFFHMQDSLADPMLSSGLLLAGLDQLEGGEDNVLTAFEASNLNLSGTDLVVLSACETGLGKIEEGEGVYGLQRGFEVAGVKYLIMSMWKVSDEATKELMTDFYKKKMAGMSVPEAFQKAQQDLRTLYPEVKYWGAFKLVGI